MPSPYYEDDAVTIYHGDWLSPSVTADRVITDPPYGTSFYETDNRPDDAALAALARDHATFAMFGYPENLVRWCVAVDLEPTEWVTWWPTNTIGGFRRSALLPRECEHIAIFGEVLGGRRLTRPRSLDTWTRAEAERRGHAAERARLGDVWRDAAPGVGFNNHLRQHPNEKPEAVMSRLVLLCSEAGDTILDPFAGSGTTLVVAKRLGRRAVGIEIEERYCEIAASRCAQEVMTIGDAA